MQITVRVEINIRDAAMLIHDLTIDVDDDTSEAEFELIMERKTADYAKKTFIFCKNYIQQINLN